MKNLSLLVLISFIALMFSCGSGESIKETADLEINNLISSQCEFYANSKLTADGTRTVEVLGKTYPCPQPPPPPPPVAPSNLRAIVLNLDQVELNWVDNSTNEDGFRVEIGFDTPNFTWARYVGPNVTSHIIPIQPYNYNRLIYFNVRAYKGSEFSDYSNMAAVITFP